MELVFLIVGVLIGTSIGISIGVFLWKSQLSATKTELTNERNSLIKNKQAEENIKDHFKAIAADALKKNNESFLTLAEENLGKFQSQAKGDLEKRQDAIQRIVLPMGESLKQVDKKIEALERDRLQAQSSLKQQIQSLTDQTHTLSTALSRPTGRGQWGEMALRRVVEIAGMTSHVDFDEQRSVDTEDGKQRPDLIVNLAGGKEIVVDAKVPMEAFLRASEAVNLESRKNHLSDHLKHTKDHINSLAKKAYWEQFESLQFVVMFIPNDAMLNAALDEDPTLNEWASQKNVLLAAPNTLIALLKASAIGWREDSMAKNAIEISTLGKELYERLTTLTSHFQSLKGGLDRAVKSYNEAVGTLERRVLVTARRFKDLGVVSDTERDISVPPIENMTRELTAGEIPIAKNEKLENQ